MLDLNNPDASKVILSDIQEKIFGIEKAMSTFLSWTDNFCLIHVSLIPVLGVKTKPTQHSVRELRDLGLTPHLLTSQSTESKRLCFPKLEAIKNEIVDIVRLDIGLGQVMVESSCLDLRKFPVPHVTFVTKQHESIQAGYPQKRGSGSAKSNKEKKQDFLGKDLGHMKSSDGNNGPRSAIGNTEKHHSIADDMTRRR
ncbi:hypothetical protein Fmac_008148 [Flemingia macrophylla]|uniref:CTP synthase N-terminal domain-containing protein n=1 Tax=Flemingia macrophylla TaxID=520843 RepID=A0ABD1MWL3_9FABA